MVDDTTIYPSMIRNQVAESFELLTQLADYGKQKRLSIPTGFVNIDKHTHGLWPGELSIVTGGPGVGKSSFAANLALNAAKLGARVLLVALGTSATETVIRMCAADGRVKIADALNGDIGESDWSALADSSNRLAELDMYIYDDSRVTFDGLASMARDVVGGEKKALIVIDGIELVTLPGFDGDHVFDWPYTVGNAAAFLKKIAREIDAPILATMDYGIGKRRIDIENYEGVFDIMSSGAESAADSIFHISRHLTSEVSGSIPSNTIFKIILAKNRLCEPTEIELAFVPDYMRFMDFAG